jgi:arylsulfatase A-like enzyme
MVTAMDDFIGNLTAELKAKNIYENSVILFISDNGGDEINGGASNDPLKGTIYIEQFLHFVQTRDKKHYNRPPVSNLIM